MDKPENKIDEVRIRLSRAVQAASSTEEREMGARPAPTDEAEIAARRGRRMAPFVVLVLAVAIFTLFYAVYVRIMIPKFDPGELPNPEQTRRKRDEDLKELERMLNERNIPGRPIPAAPAAPMSSPEPQASPAP